MDYSKLRVNTKVKNESLELDEPVSPTTEYFLSEVVTLYVLGFMELEIPVDFSTIFAFIKDVFAKAHPRFSSIVIEDRKGKKMWKKVEVNVEDHIKVPNFPEDLSAESYKDHYDDYISSISTSQLPQHKPLWEIHIINNPKHIDAKGVFLFKVHHAIGDGTSLMGVFLTCVKRVDDPTLPCTFPAKSTSSTLQRKMSNTKQIVMNMFNIFPRFIAPIIYSLYDFGQGVGSIFIEDDLTPIRSGNVDTSLPGSSRVCSMTFSLHDVKRIKTLLGVTINDIIVGMIFLGTQLYIREKDPGQLKEKQSTASIFVNVRSTKGNFSAEEMRQGKTFGNRITNIEVPFPNLEDDDLIKPLQFIKKAHNIIKRKRNGALGLYLMASLLEVIRTIGGLKNEGRKGRKVWKKVEVNVQDHIKVPNFPEELSAESYSKYFDDYVSSIATSQLPQHKPLWELHIINNPKHINAAGLFLFKVHHAIGDGTSFMVGILSCFKRVDDPSLPVTYPLKTTSTATRNLGKEKKTMMVNMFKILPKLLYSSVYSLYDFGQGVGSTFIKDDKSPIRSGKIDTSLSGSTRVCSVNLSLDDVKRIKTLLGVTVNDIIVGIIFLGTQLYIKEKDPKHYQKNRRSRASIYVNVRSMKGNLSLKEMRKGKTWGNRIANIEVPLPNLEDDDLTKPLQFIKKAHKIIKRKRNGLFGLYLMDGLLKVVRTFGGLQAAARTFERKWKNCSFAITNMIGPTEQVSFANHPVNGFYFVPTGIDLSLVVSVLSYMENLRLGFVIENGFIDHQRLIACVEKAFQLIYEAAT